MTRQMSHSVATNAAYYQAIVGEQHAANAYKSMADLRELKRENRSYREGSPKPGTRRRLFSVSESELVRTYFILHVRRRATPTIQECSKFLEMNPMPPRSPKNIQDKVKTFVRNA